MAPSPVAQVATPASREGTSNDRNSSPVRTAKNEDPQEKGELNIVGASAVQTTPDVGRLSRWRLALVVLSLWIGTFLVAIDTTIISVAIPRIATELEAFDHIGWYGSAYLFTVTAFQPAFGAVFRFFDAKWAYLSSIVVFEVGSVLCAAGPISAVFILGRAVQGVGAAGLYQGALAIINLTVSPARRPMAIGTVLSVFGCAVCFGPPVGGLLTDHLTWRWCFWINLPIGAAAFLVLIFILKLPQVTTERTLPLSHKLNRLDYPGIVLIVGAVCCLVLVLQWGGQEKPWSSADVIGLFIGAGLLLAAFAAVQWRKGEEATIPPRIFLQRSVLMGALYLFFLEMSIYAYLFYLPFYFQSAQLVDAAESGIRAIPLGLSQIVAVVLCSAAVTRLGHYVPIMIAGQLVAIVSNVFMTRMTVDTPTAVWAAYFVVTGIGTGMGLQLPFTAAPLVLDKEDVPVGNAIIGFLQPLGAAVAVAAGQSVFSRGLRDMMAQSPGMLPSPEAVISVGPTGIGVLTSDPAVIRMIQNAYCQGFVYTMYYGLAALVIAVLFAVSMEWLNAKKTVAKRADILDGVSEGTTKVEAA